MISFIKGLFSGDDDSAANKLIDGATSGLDKLVLTDEEELDFRNKAYSLWLKMQEKLGDANSVRAKARRLLAVSVTFTFLFTFLVAVIHVFVGFWFGVDMTKLIVQISKLATSFKLGELTLSVFVFYFGKGIIDNLRAGK